MASAGNEPGGIEAADEDTAGDDAAAWEGTKMPAGGAAVKLAPATLETVEMAGLLGEELEKPPPEVGPALAPKPMPGGDVQPGGDEPPGGAPPEPGDPALLPVPRAR